MEWYVPAMATTLSAKLQLKPGQRLLLQNAPRAMRSLVSELLPGVTISRSAEAEAVLLFVNDLKEAETLAPAALKSVGEQGLVWIAYPKGTSSMKTDVNRDNLRSALEPLGWDTVRIVAVDETWSALRFRPFAVVKAGQRR